MPYATIEDVQSRVPTQTWDSNSGTAQPTAAQVTGWLNELSGWVDATLTWRYVTPVTDAGDVTLLKPIVEALAAARVIGAKVAYRPDQPHAGEQLRREALQMLAYDAKTGRSMLALANSAYAEVREAALQEAVSTFTDPDVDCQNPRLFTMDMRF